MSNTAPLRLNGAKFRADKTGLVSIVEPWEVYTLEDCATFSPSSRPLGLPITDRSAEEFEVGTWHLNLTYEGQAGGGEVSFDNDDALEVELDVSMAQDPIKSHPNFDKLKIAYGWLSDKEEFSETLPDQGGQQTALSSGAKKSRKNPLHGVDSYLVVGAIFRLTFTAARAPQDVLDGIGTVVDRPPGWSLLGIAHPKGRNWLKLAPKVRRIGNATRVVPEYMLSGPNGWIKDVYGAQQLRA